MDTKTHSYYFGQMPTRKTKINGELYRRLEISEIILSDDIVEFKHYPETGYRPAWETIAGMKYNPISIHKGLIIWRKDNDSKI